MPHKKTFSFHSAAQATFNTENVDLENRIIKDVIIAEQIEIKDGRGYGIDDEFMQDFVSMSDPDGITVEADHNFYGAFGKKAGKITNVRFEQSDKTLRGDLYVYKSADLSPNQQGLGTYILESIKEDYKSYMMSMKINVDHFYALEDGEKKQLEEKFSWELGRYFTLDGKPYDGTAYMKLARIYSVDVVNEGAFTNSMFSTKEDQLIDFLNEIGTEEGFKEFLESNHEKLQAFHAFYTDKLQVPKVEKIKKEIQALFGSGGQDKVIAELEAAHKTKTDLLTAEIKGINKEKETLAEQLATAMTKITALNEKIEELSALPVGTLPAGEGEGNQGNADEVDFMSHPVNQRAMTIYNRKHNKNT